MRKTAYIYKDTLKLIRETKGVSIEFLEKKNVSSAEIISKWEDTKDDLFPTINQAKKIAAALEIPFASLYILPENINIDKIPSIKNMRRIYESESIDSSSVNLATYQLIEAHSLYIELMQVLEEKTINFSSYIDISNYESLAMEIREKFDIDLNIQLKTTSSRKFYLYVRNQVEKNGIFINGFDGVNVNLLRGLAIYDNDYPIIGINNNDRHPAKTFTIFHELVHIFNNESTSCNQMFDSFEANKEEIFCNAVAGEVLAPREILIDMIGTENLNLANFTSIEKLAEVFSVSKEVIIRRLLDIGEINQSKYDLFNRHIRLIYENQNEKNRKLRELGESPEFYQWISRKAVDANSSILSQAMYKAYSNDIIDKQDIARYINKSYKHIDRFLNEVSRWTN